MKHLIPLALLLLVAGCGGKSTKSIVSTAQAVGPAFNADSAYAHCEAQCLFGPRTMNSAAHDSCAQWIARKFGSYGLQVSQQQATLRGYDGTPLKATNIIARHRPDERERVLLCAHWDTRPWADNDPDEQHWRTPIDGANDGASGVAVLIEIARLVSMADSLSVGIDFVCFDAEDWGVPQWDATADAADSWALGSQHWADQAAKEGYKARFGILLDMVGGQGAQFYQEGVSLEFAPSIVDKVWRAATVVGYSSFFPTQPGGYVTDDHIAVNAVAKVPTIDIVPYYPDYPASNFGPTWHTLDDNMQHIDRNTLRAVGQTVVQVIYSEK